MAKVQYNPSTGKVLYNPKTGKVMMARPANECSHCLPELTPTQLSVTFSGLTLCTECTWCSPPTIFWYCKWTELKDPNDTYIASQISNCAWKTNLITGLISRKQYLTSNCTGEYNEATLDGYVQVVRAADTMSVQFWVIESPTLNFWIFYNSSVIPTSGCVEVSGAANTISCGGSSYSVYTSGTVDIVEL